MFTFNEANLVTQMNKEILLIWTKGCGDQKKLFNLK